MKFEDIIFLENIVSPQGVNEHTISLDRGENLKPLDVIKCVHDGKIYLEDGKHTSYVLYKNLIVSHDVNVRDCTNYSWMYGFADNTCTIKEFFPGEKYIIDDLKIDHSL